MGVSERRARHKETLRRQILDAAREVFVKEGYENVSMRKIAERIEYSPTTIYLYFKDKADLLNHLSEEVFARLLEVIQKMRAETSDPIELLQNGLRAYIDFGLTNADDYRVTFLIGERRPPEEAPIGWQAYGFLRSTVEECIRCGKLKQMDVETATESLWAAVHGVTSLLIIHTEFPWVNRDQLIESVIQMAIRGLSV